MPLVLRDRVKETTTTTGTGTLTLAGAATGFQSFSVIGNGNTTYYCIASQGSSEWEVGIGTYTSAGTTLARTTVLASSNAGSLVALSAGTKDVFVVYPSGRAVAVDGTTFATYGMGATQGDIVYASATDTFSRLAKDATATRYLSNTGASNNPAWAQVNLANGVTGTLPVANGGTGQTTYTDGQLLIGNSAGNTLTKATLTAGSNITITNGAGAITIAAASGGISSADIQEFTTAGTSTWTKPSGAKFVYVLLIAGGGGGGSGRRRATASVATAAFGGAGAGSGGRSELFIPASSLSATETVTVGAGGTGGASITTDDTSGNSGTTGGNSSFGSWALARGGASATGGSTSFSFLGSGGGAVVVASVGSFTTAGLQLQTGSGADGTSGKTGSDALRGGYQGGGGGGGSGFNASFTASLTAANGGLGGAIYSTDNSNSGGGGAGGSAGSAGSNGANASSYFVGGSGGGGGSSSSVATAGSGGNGGYPGGGGGGGGAGHGQNSGAGGNGGAGYVRVVTFF